MSFIEFQGPMVRKFDHKKDHFCNFYFLTLFRSIISQMIFKRVELIEFIEIFVNEFILRGILDILIRGSFYSLLENTKMFLISYFLFLFLLK